LDKSDGKTNTIVDLCRAKDARAALSEALALVDRGYGDALFLLGAIYEVGGEGVIPDPSKAAFYYKRAVCEVGAAPAWLGLARLHFLGKGVPQDYDEAFRCYAVVAEDGDDPMAWLMMGRMYLEGKGVKKNLLRAREYLNKAASRDYVFAFTFLGHLEWACGRPWKAIPFFLRAGWLALITNRRDPRSQLG